MARQVAFGEAPSAELVLGEGLGRQRGRRAAGDVDVEEVLAAAALVDLGPPASGARNEVVAAQLLGDRVREHRAIGRVGTGG